MAIDNNFGLSFVPAGDQPSARGGGGAPVEPVQSAIQYLTVRLPKFPQGAVVAPPSLLTSPGGLGSPFARNAIGQTQPQTFAAGLASPPLAGTVSPSIGPFPSLSDPLLQALMFLSGNGPRVPAPPVAPPRIEIHDTSPTVETPAPTLPAPTMPNVDRSPIGGSDRRQVRMV